MDQKNNSSFVLTNENSTKIDVGNDTDSSSDQNSSPSVHDDTVSVVLIPLVIIGNIMHF